jgi:hypothetical protein
MAENQKEQARLARSLSSKITGLAVWGSIWLVLRSTHTTENSQLRDSTGLGPDFLCSVNRLAEARTARYAGEYLITSR